MTEYHKVCLVSDVAEGAGRMFIVDGQRLGVFHIEGKFYAIDDACSHAGASLSLGYIDGDIVSCRIHHWRFCIRDGKYLDEPKPVCNVQAYPVHVEGSQVWVRIATDQLGRSHSRDVE